MLKTSKVDATIERYRDNMMNRLRVLQDELYDLENDLRTDEQLPASGSLREAMFALLDQLDIVNYYEDAKYLIENENPEEETKNEAE